MEDGAVADLTLASLASLARWVAWRNEERAGKLTKVPYAPTSGRRAKADDPATWSTRAAAEAAASRLVGPLGGGVGLELGDLGDGPALGGIDLDSCCDATGTLAPWAADVLTRFGTYAEVSPSGTGVKAFFLYAAADLPVLREAMGTSWGKAWKRGAGDHPQAIELHLGNRYFAVTDARLPDAPAEMRAVPAELLLQLIRETGPAFATSAPSAAAARATRSGTDGSRSGAALRIGAKVRRAGGSYDDMVVALRADPQTAEWVREKGEANGGRELRRIWDKGVEPSDELILSPGAPLVSARRFLELRHTAAGLRTLHHQQAAFYAWDGTCYVETPVEEMRARLYAFLDGAKRKTDEGETVPFDPTRAKVANVLEATAAEAQLPASVRPPAWLGGEGHPDPAEVIACANGLLHLPTRRMHAHTPAFFSTNALPYRYEPKAPAPAEWLKFLAAVWPDDPQAITTLQEMFGLLLTGETKHQKAFLIVGPKRSGKGTIARILVQLLGAANVAGPTLSSLAQNFGLAPLIGKRAAIVSDARLGGRVDQQVIVERLLSVTGEDGITVDRKFRDSWTGQLGVRFILMTNELPRLTDASGALAGRFVVLVMRRSFYGKEDLGLMGRLLPELPGILGWALAGYDRLTARGHFVAPDSSQLATEELENLGSPIGAFLRDCCDVGAGLGIRCDDLYRLWCTWCEEQGRDHPGNAQAFGRDLRAAVPGLETKQYREDGGGRTRFFEGVGRNPEHLSRDVTRDRALHSAFPAGQHEAA